VKQPEANITFPNWLKASIEDSLSVPLVAIYNVVEDDSLKQ